MSLSCRSSGVFHMQRPSGCQRPTVLSILDCQQRSPQLVDLRLAQYRARDCWGLALAAFKCCPAHWNLRHVIPPSAAQLQSTIKAISDFASFVIRSEKWLAALTGLSCAHVPSAWRCWSRSRSPRVNSQVLCNHRAIQVSPTSSPLGYSSCTRGAPQANQTRI